MINLAGKKGVIMGVANELSIAWGIAKQLTDSGAELCFTYQGDALFKRVKPLAESIQNNFTKVIFFLFHVVTKISLMRH